MTAPSADLVARRAQIVNSIPLELREWIRQDHPEIFATIAELETATEQLEKMGVSHRYDDFVERLAHLWRDRWERWKGHK